MKARFAPCSVRWGAIVVVLIVFGTLVSAQTAPVGKAYDLTLRAPARVGDTVLVAGAYRVTHVMENEQHVMLFRSLRKDHKEYRAICKMRELPAVAAHDEQRFEEVSGKERVLTTLVFAGDKVEHLF